MFSFPICLPEVKVFFAWVEQHIGLHHPRVVRGGAVHGGYHCPDQYLVIIVHRVQASWIAESQNKI